MTPLRLEVLKMTPKRLPRTRLEELAHTLAPNGRLPDNTVGSQLWTYRSVQMYLEPKHHIHAWEKRQCDYQLILWDSDKVVAELYGVLYANRAVVGGLHSDVNGGGTRLMRHFARLAGHRPIQLNAIEPSLGFYLKLGLRLTDEATSSHHPMVWPPEVQASAASLA